MSYELSERLAEYVPSLVDKVAKYTIRAECDGTLKVTVPPKFPFDFDVEILHEHNHPFSK